MTTEASHKVGIVLHVDENLDEPRRDTISYTLESEQSIGSAHFTHGRPHLMIVEYDPDLTSSVSVLDSVKHQHVHAELIGPI